MEMTEYLRVQRQLMDQIHKGVYRENGKLPTERELCEQFGVSRITIRQALQNMENEGVIVRQQGRGTFVKPRRIEQRLSSIYSFSEDLRKQNMLFCMLSVLLYDELAVNRCSSLGYVSMQIQTERYLVIF